MGVKRVYTNVRDLLQHLSDGTGTFCRKVLCHELPLWGQMLELFAIKYLYILLVVFILSGKVYPGYGSYGVDFVLWKECVASVLFLAVAAGYLYFPMKDRFVGLFTHILFVIYYVPVNSAFALNDTTWKFFLLSNLYFVLLLVGLYWLSRALEGKLTVLSPKGVGTKGSRAETAVGIFCMVVCVLFTIHKLVYNGLDFSFSGIYENRADYANYLRSISGTLHAYVLAIVRYVVTYVVPFSIVVSLVRKKPVFLILSFLAALSMFAVSSEKGKLLMPVLAIGIYICYRMDLLKNFRRVVTVGVILLLLFCLAEGAVFGQSRVFTLLIRREMYFPAWLNTLYYDFFSQNDKLFWTQNVFGLQTILEPVYDLSPLELISNTYFEGLVPSPNTGLFAEAYMHFGIAGMVIYPTLLSVLVLAVSRVVSGYGSVVQTLFALQMVLGLTNVPALRTDFVLSCFLFAVLLWLLPTIAVKTKPLELQRKFLELRAKNREK